LVNYPKDWFKPTASKAKRIAMEEEYLANIHKEQEELKERLKRENA
jgi:hypothetical protein